jgi:deoxyhypusine synthase
MFVIESDATIVAPLLLTALLECKANPEKANALIEKTVGKAKRRGKKP